jgi:hypothetical protein
VKRGPKPIVEYDGKSYTTRKWNIEIPDLNAMTSTEALVWLVRNTTPRGYSKYKPNLSGLTMTVR